MKTRLAPTVSLLLALLPTAHAQIDGVVVPASIPTNVGAPVASVTPPPDRTVAAGLAPTLWVVAEGAPPLSYQWQCNNTNLPLATNAALTLPNIQPSQAGPYRVVVTNLLGATTSAVAQVTVLVWTNGVFWEGGGDGVSWSDPSNWSGHTVPGANDDVLIAAASSNTVVYQGSQPTIRSLCVYDRLSLQGSGIGHAVLSASRDVTNHGTIILDTTHGSHSATLNVGGTLANAPEGVLQVNPGAGSYRALNANVLNQGTITVAAGISLYCNGAGKVFRQQAGSLNGSGLFTWADGGFEFLGGNLSGVVCVRDGTLEVADTAGASTIYAMGHTTLVANRSTQATVWVQGNGFYGQAILTTAEGAVNAGTIRLESSHGSYGSVMVVGGVNLLNTARGVILARAGAGNARTLSGYLINQGLVDGGDYYLDIYGTYEAAGGRVAGPARLRSANVRVTASPPEPTTIDLWGNCTLLTDNLANTILYVHGNGEGGHAVLSASENVANRGTIVLDSTHGSYSATLSVGGALFNAAEGVLQVNAGSGNSRALNANVLNQGTVNVGGGISLYCNGAGKVFRQEAGSLNGAGLFTWADGAFDFVGGDLSGMVCVRNGTLEVADTAGASTIYAMGNTTLVANRSTQAIVWVQGNGFYGHATLTTAERAVNAGTIRLESSHGSYWSVVAVGGSDLLNTATGVIVARSGAGSARSLSGYLINQGLVDGGDYYLDIYGTYEAAGGRMAGPARLRSANVRVTASPPAPTTIDLWGNCTLLTDNLANTILYVHGGGDRHAVLSASGDVTNRGTIVLDTTHGSYSATLSVGGTLVNAPEGVLQVNPGAGSYRALNANVLNQGTISVAGGISLYCNGAGKVFRQQAGSLDGSGLFTWADGEFNFLGGDLSGVVCVRDGTLEVADTAGASTIYAMGHTTLVANRSRQATVWVQGNGVYGQATLTTAEGAVNAGTIRLESSHSAYGSVLVVGGANLLNTATGAIVARSGAGSARSLSGYLINQGLVDGGDYYLDIYGTYEAAGGRMAGPARLRSANVRVTASSPEPTTIDLWGNCTLLTDNLPNTILYVHGGGEGGHAVLSASGNVTNRGTILLDTTHSAYGATLSVGGTLFNAAEGVLQINPGSGNNRAVNGELFNAGTVNFNYGASLGRAGANHINTGAFRLANATASILGASFLNQGAGEIAGTGTFSCPGVNFQNSGTVSPGASAGTLTFVGAYTQTADGRLNVEIGGLATGSEYDRLAINGTASLDGWLSVSLINEFLPAVSNVFRVLTCHALSGQFSRYTGLVYYTNAALSAGYLANAVDLTALSGANLPVEEPKIVVPPRSLSVIQGQTATFRVTANGTQPFAYQWYLNGGALAHATNALLVLPNVQTNQAGLYAVRITNTAGAALSSEATLLVRQITDLIVTEVAAATNDAVAGQPLVVSWRSVNAGSAPAFGPWVETLALSTNASGANPLPLAAWTFTNTLMPGQSLARTQAVILPGGLEGRYFIAVTTDASNAVPEDVFETNNTSVSTEFVTIRAPDLIVDSVAAPAAAQFGQTIPVAWTVDNRGSAEAAAGWSDRLYLSAASNHLHGATALLTLPAAQALAAGQHYTRTQTVMLPLSSSLTPGDYFLIAVADAGQTVAESNEANNLASVALALTWPPLPDLTAGSVASPAQALPGQTIPVTWTVTNIGTAPVTGVWSEAVYLSLDTLIGGDPLLGIFVFTNDLPVGASVTRTRNVVLPVAGAAGPLRLVVQVDAQGEVVESVETNNTAVAELPILVPATLTLQVPFSHVPENTASPIFQALVLRNGVLPAPLLVSLASSQPNQLTLPASVTIPANQSSATVPVTVVWDHTPGADQTVALTASYPGFSNGTAVVTVLNVDMPQLALEVASAGVGEGETVSATVRRSPATSQPLVVSLASSSLADLALPASVTIPANSSTAAFSLVAPDNPLLEPARACTVTASAAGHLSATTNLWVWDNDLPALSLTLSSSTISEAAGPNAAFGTVMRAPASEIAVVVDLESSDTNAARVPRSVTIPANEALATFPISAVDNALAGGPRTVTISAFVTDSLRGSRLGAPATNAIVVTDDDGPTLTLALDRAVLPEGSNTLATVSRNTPATNALSVTLASSSTHEAVVPASVMIPAGTNAARFVVTTLNDGVPNGTKLVTLTASASGFNSGSALLRVTDIDLPDLVVTEVSGPASGLTKQLTSLSFRVANQGLAPLTNTIRQRVWLSSDPLPSADDVAVGDFAFNQNQAPIPPGFSFAQTVSVFLPPRPGDYWIIVQADAQNVTSEIDKQNNTRVSATPIHVTADYAAIVQAGLTTALAGTPVPLRGEVVMADGQSPEGKLVNVHLLVRGFHRVVSALAQADGRFELTYFPLPGEAGIYRIGAEHPGLDSAPAQDQFTLFGARADPASLTLKLDEASSLSGYVTLANLGDAPLTGLAATAIDVPASLIVSAAVTSDTLPGSGSLRLNYSLTTSISSPLPTGFTLRATSAEGVSVDVPVSVTVRPAQPALVALPGTLAAGMVRGGQKLVAFQVVNQGGATSGPVQLVLPQVSWMTVANTNPLPPLAPDATNTVTLQLTPPADLPLTAYQGQLAVLGGAAPLAVPFNFRALSEALGDLSVRVEDELTYYAAGQPHVTNATVRLLDPFTRAVMHQAATDNTGTAEFHSLREGPYTLQVQAPKHGDFNATLRVEAGQANAARAFVPLQTVVYSWTAVPTDVPDHYRLSIESTFEANVPLPVVTLDKPLIVPLVSPGRATETSVTFTNHGLIAAKGLRIQATSTRSYKLTPLITDVGDLAPHSSITVPVLVQLQPELDALVLDALSAHTTGLGQGARRAGPKSAGSLGFLDECASPALEGQWYVVCGEDRRWHFEKAEVKPLLWIDVLTTCGQSLKDAAPDLLTSPVAATMGAVCECLVPAVQKVADWLGLPYDPKPMECVCAVVGRDPIGIATKCVCYKGGVGLPPHVEGGGGEGGGDFVDLNPQEFPSGDCLTGLKIPLKPVMLAGAGAPGQDARRDAPAGSPGICAQVRLRLDQDLVLTRTGFRATLQLDNHTPDLALADVVLRLDFLDDTGALVNERFVLTATNLAGITALDGTGVVPANASATAEFTILPTAEAAPDGPRAYAVGGELRYTLGADQFVIPLYPAILGVMPDASLRLTYFHQRDVFADDPYTPQVEPSLPYALAVLVQNTGQGVAKDLTITSAQPKIIDNEKGLLIDFQLIASEVEGQNLSPSLTVRLGDVAPGANVIARWLFTSSLQGLFVDYAATFEHLDGLGNQKLSLIDAVDIHELTRIVRAPVGGGRPSFLVNDLPDPDDLPDTIYLSDGTVQPVAAVRAASFDHAPANASLEVVLAAPLPASGFACLRAADPQGAAGPLGYRLAAVRRSDGTPLPPENFWQTDRTFTGQGRPPIHENLLHLLDYQSTGSYTLTYAPVAAADTTPPSSAVAALPADRYAPVPLSWSGQDEPGGSGLAYFDIFVSMNGGPFTRWLDHTTARAALYPGVLGSSYAFYSLATDNAGNTEAPPATPDAQTTVSLVNLPPVLTVGADQTVDEGQTVVIANSATNANADQTLTFSLLSAPNTAAINPANGLISWPTTETDGPGTITFRVVVTDNGLPPLSATGAVTVVVRELNSAPVLAPIPDFTINEGFPLVITNVAADFDLPPNALSFSLGPGAPPGATINAANGVFRWQPTDHQGPSTNRIVVIATDNGVPPLSATQPFTVIVRDTLAEVALAIGSTNLMAGETNSVSIRLSASLALSELALTLEAPGDRVTNLLATPVSSELISVQAQFDGTNQNRFTLTLDPGALPPSERELARLQFLAVPQEHSAIAPLRVTSFTAKNAAGQAVANVLSADGRVFIVGREALLVANRGAAPSLTIYGHPGAGCVIESSTNLAAGAVWTEVNRLALPSRSVTVNSLPVLGNPQFFRARESTLSRSAN